MNIITHNKIILTFKVSLCAHLHDES